MASTPTPRGGRAGNAMWAGRPEITQVDLVHAQREAEQSAKVGVRGASAEAIGGVGAIAAATLGLAGVGRPVVMAVIATVCIGLGLFAEGVAIARRFRKLHRQTGGGLGGGVALGSGTAVQVVGGVAGIVLGGLALFFYNIATVLLATTVITLGASLLLGSIGTSRMGRFEMPDRGKRPRSIARAAMRASAGVQVVVGIVAIALGVLALLELGGEVGPTGLLLGAMLGIGISILLSGTAMAVVVGGR